MARQGSSHLVGGNLVKLTGNAAGTSWSAPTTIIDTAKDIRDVEVTTLSNGKVICSYTERTAGSEDFVPKVIISTDSGATWGSPITITHGFTGFGFITAKIVELPGGNLLAPIYGIDSGGVNGTDDYCRLSRSTDGGASWSAYSTIVAHGTSGKAWNEPNVVRRASGELVCTIRCEDGPNVYLARSNDSGATWGAPALAVAGGGRPSLHETPDANLALMHRASETGLAYAHWSFDGGTTWPFAVHLGGFTPFVYGSWVDLANGQLGALWAIEEFADNDTDADLHFTAFDYDAV